MAKRKKPIKAIQMSDDMIIKITKSAEKNGRNFSQEVRLAVREHLKNEEEK